MMNSILLQYLDDYFNLLQFQFLFIYINWSIVSLYLIDHWLDFNHISILVLYTWCRWLHYSVRAVGYQQRFRFWFRRPERLECISTFNWPLLSKAQQRQEKVVKKVRICTTPFGPVVRFGNSWARVPTPRRQW